MLTSVSETAKDINGSFTAARKADMLAFVDNLYPGQLKNPKAHTQQLEYDKRFGVPVKVTDAKNQISTTQLDAIGREIKSTSANGALSQRVMFYCQYSAPLNCPQNAAYGIASQTTHPAMPGYFGEPLSVVYFDALQREIRAETYSLNGDVVKVDTQYDSAGRVARKSEPFTLGSAQYWTTFSHYDALNRPLTIASPDGGGIRYEYYKAGNESVVKNTVVVQSPLGSTEQIKTTYSNAPGLPSKVIDHEGMQVIYSYNAQGHLASTEVDNNADTLILIDYDVAGNRIFLSDPSAGDVTFAYNGFGGCANKPSKKIPRTKNPSRLVWIRSAGTPNA